MSSDLRKMVSFIEVGGSNQWGGYDLPQNTYYTSASGTVWIRVFAEWEWLQPVAGYPPGTYPSSIGYGYPVPSQYLAEIDNAVSTAAAQGRNVTLTARGFPDWVNPNTYNARKSQYPNSARYLCFPDDLSASGPWAQWIFWLMTRYNRVQNPSRAISVLEFVNEANSECWPQPGSDGQYDSSDSAACRTVQMFQTVQTLLNLVPAGLLVAGPATADRSTTTIGHTQFDNFTQYVAYGLRNANWNNDSRFIWSHHNYEDILNDRGPSSLKGQTTIDAATVRQLLTGYWGGWPDSNENSPRIWLTEGGADRNKFLTAWPSGFNGIVPHPPDNTHSSPWYDVNQLDQIQLQLWQRAWYRLANDISGQGAGISAVANWEMYSGPSGFFDTGLLDYNPTPGTGDRQRPLYSFWASLPSRA